MDNIQQVNISEESLIGACLRGGAPAFETAREIVAVSDFRSHVYSWAWAAMETLHTNGLGVDVFTVWDELERAGHAADFVRGQWSGRALLSQLRTDGDPRNVTSYAENVKDYATKRELLMLSNTIAQDAANGKRSGEIISNATLKLAAMEAYTTKDEHTVAMKVAVSEAYDRTDAASRGENIGVLTGLTDLDKVLSSLLPGELYVVGARPAQGKTALLLTIAKNAAEKGKRVAIFSLEMSRALVAQRLISQEAKVDLFKIIHGKMEDREWPLYTHAVEVVADLPIVINDLSSININTIRHTARKIRQGGLDLIIVDYIQLADATGREENRQLEVAKISRGLKWLAGELNVPVLAASQLSRRIEERSDKKPVLSDLRESGSLEQDSYCVMFIHCPDEMKPNNRDIIVAKHRNGPVGNVPVFFKGEYTRFENAYVRLP